MPKLLVRKNLWPNPEHAPQFRPALEAYRAACLKLMRQLIRIVAVAIGEKEDFFDKKSEGGRPAVVRSAYGRAFTLLPHFRSPQ